MRAEFIAIGSELIRGWVCDTHLATLARWLGGRGLVLSRATTVPDDLSAIVEAVQAALGRSRLVLTTGGLGPTRDDVTRRAVAVALERPLVRDPEWARRITDYCRHREVLADEMMLGQADFPRGMLPLANDCGTAPGGVITVDDRVLAVLPGPQAELLGMLSPLGDYLGRSGLFSDAGAVLTRAIRVVGRGESTVGRAVEPLFERDDLGVTLLAGQGQVTVWLTSRGDGARALRALDEAEAFAREVLGNAVLGVDGDTLEETVARMLTERELTIGTAESCTAGLVSAKLTSTAGSSRFFVGGVTAYANDIKVSLLGVKPGTLADSGAVSEAVAGQMADGIRSALGCDIGVAVTGVAGPTGGTVTKPVGTVFVAVADADGVVTERHRFPQDRYAVREWSAQAALALVRRRLLGKTDQL